MVGFGKFVRGVHNFVMIDWKERKTGDAVFGSNLTFPRKRLQCVIQNAVKTKQLRTCHERPARVLLAKGQLNIFKVRTLKHYFLTRHFTVVWSCLTTVWPGFQTSTFLDTKQSCVWRCLVTKHFPFGQSFSATVIRIEHGLIILFRNYWTRGNTLRFHKVQPSYLYRVCWEWSREEMYQKS